MSWLHRAIVTLPQQLDIRSLGGWSGGERIVFFETPSYTTHAGTHLKSLLASVWNFDADAIAEGFYNLHSEQELRERAFRSQVKDDLFLLETGCGGVPPHAVGPEHAHYATPDRVDMFVTPRNNARLQAAFAKVEQLRRVDERAGPSAWILHHREEIQDAIVPTVSRELAGPIYRLKVRLPHGAYEEEVLVDAARLPAASAKALKASGAAVARRASPKARASQAGHVGETLLNWLAAFAIALLLAWTPAEARAGVLQEDTGSLLVWAIAATLAIVLLALWLRERWFAAKNVLTFRTADAGALDRQTRRALAQASDYRQSVGLPRISPDQATAAREKAELDALRFLKGVDVRNPFEPHTRAWVIWDATFHIECLKHVECEGSCDGGQKACFCRRSIVQDRWAVAISCPHPYQLAETLRSVQ